ncbi:NAD(P)-dependent alcohol dehydrogenase [Paracoccus denitrificans]|uniref:NAD(P)-dependent alcohol dehydrogenase n=1 Tax=Paracoccus denitrificans TaxID=266 RepID=UPI001E4C54C9|nr:NAD(P)-dependent alcohol dehydrogenase [Paracoccus denitrificans]UFS67393.1 NAD(P)-dependent alcohol dehydrogenase [Paracoccus denitrificans]
MKTIGYAATSPNLPLARHDIERRDLRDNDVGIEILYCGVCHSDLHQARNDWGGTIYPVVPGHEIVGRVTGVGSAVTRYEAGDTVAVGCIVDSCGTCDQCLKHEEQMCREGVTQTYNDRDRITGEVTYGGYSRHIVVREEFVLAIPKGLDIARAAPLLCAGITTWSPLRTWNVGPGSRVGVVGLGGLGHMAVKLAVGLGAEVTVISRTDAKTADALALGADRVLASGDAAAMAGAASSFDLIIDTIPVRHDLSPYLPLLDVDATLVIVGQLGMVDEHSTLPLLMGRRRISGSPIGGIAETQEMLNFCARMNILPDCEMIAIQDINTAFERMERADVRYRFVIDMASLEAV